MAAGDVIFADGFESGNIAWTYTAGTFDYSPSYSRVAGSGQGLRFSSTNAVSHYLRKDFQNGGVNEIIFGLAIQFTNLSQGNSNNIITFGDGTSYGCGLHVDSNGAVTFGRKANSNIGTTLGISRSGLIQLNNWYWIDGKVKIHNTAGYFDYRVNNILIASGYNVDTSQSATNLPISTVLLNGSDTGVNALLYYDDLYIIDNTNQAATYLGDIRVLDIVPSGDAFHKGFTPSTGTTHYNLIDEQTTTDDNDYVSTATSGTLDTYYYTDLPSNVQSIYGVMYGNRVKKNEAGTRTIRVVHRQSGVDYERPTSDQNLSNSFAWYQHTERINPATGVAYTLDEINNTAEFGFKLQA